MSSSSLPESRPLSTNRLIAVGWAVLSSACLATLWVLVRHVSGHIHAFEITFFASIFGLVAFVPAILKGGRSFFYTRRPGTQILRGVLNSCGILAWFWALTLMPLADAAALGLMAPLAATIAAMLILKEKVRPERWFALGLGAAGALVIIRPGFQEISLGVWLVFVMVGFSALQRTVAKTLAGTESSSATVVYLILTQIPITFVAALFVWKAPQLSDYLFLFGIGMLLSAAHFCLMQSLRLADLSALEPFSFTRLIFVAVLAFIFFREVPDMWTWIGGLLIIVATSTLARRETGPKAKAK